jgi:multidrug efflux pump subunit AcrA (membrane-fusion protein)
MTVWVAAGGGKFLKRIVKAGLSYEGFTEMQDGLKEGEAVAVDGALFIANQYTNAGH